jgi:hypothetical protein
VKILDRYPISTVERSISSPDGPFTVKPYQVPVVVCLKIGDHLSSAFPAFIDSGHNHNFSITEEHLRRWAKIDVDRLSVVGKLRISNEEVKLRAANLLIYCNKKGTFEFTQRSHEIYLENDRGIAVHSKPISTLPLIGIRALIRNKISVAFDARGLFVNLSAE